MYLYLLIVCLCLVVVLYFVFLFLFFKMEKDLESESSYECGFNIYSINRMNFSYRFFLISILFIIFDVEISLMLPSPFINNVFGGLLFFIFVLVLILGLLYEYNNKALDWMDSSISKA